MLDRAGHVLHGMLWPVLKATPNAMPIAAGRSLLALDDLTGGRHGCCIRHHLITGGAPTAVGAGTTSTTPAANETDLVCNGIPVLPTGYPGNRQVLAPLGLDLRF